MALLPAVSDVDEMASNRPVLKHGPRSLTYVRVIGWQTQVRNESDWEGGGSSFDASRAPSTDLKFLDGFE